MSNLNEIMNKSTNKNFYPSSGGNDEKIKSLMEVIDEKDAEFKKMENKYNQLFISKKSFYSGKSKVKGTSNEPNRAVEAKLQQL